MAKIIGGIATSHTPTIGFALDQHKENDPAWAPIFEGYRPVQEWLKEKQPDVILLIANDHITSFFFDHYSPFTLGIGKEWRAADEGGGARNIPPIQGHPALARHIVSGLVADEFDMSVYQNRPLDHGCFSPLSVMWPHDGGWPGAMIPLIVGVLLFPIPSAARCYKLGQSVRRAIESYPEDIKVVIVATGGLSHQVSGERCGFNNVEWDMQFLDLIEKDPEQLTRMTHADYARLGGLEGAEVIMWLIMRGALSASVKKLHQSYYLPSMTGIATAIYENEASETPDSLKQETLAKMAHQMAGAEELQGTYPFTLQRSVERYAINKFLHDLVIPEHRAKFKADPEAAFEEAGLPENERDMIRRRDWQGMIRYGVIFFMLEKLGAVVGVSNLHIYSAMRGQTLEEFQQTRNQKVLYSVAGTDTPKPAWDRK